MLPSLCFDSAHKHTLYVIHPHARIPRADAIAAVYHCEDHPGCRSVIHTNVYAVRSCKDTHGYNAPQRCTLIWSLQMLKNRSIYYMK